MKTKEQLIAELPERLRKYNQTDPFIDLDSANLAVYYNHALVCELSDVLNSMQPQLAWATGIRRSDA